MEALKTLWTKVTSRKFLAAVTVIITGIVMAVTGDSQADAGVLTEKAAGAVVALIAAVSYIISEAKVDAAREAGSSE